MTDHVGEEGMGALVARSREAWHARPEAPVHADRQILFDGDRPERIERRVIEREAVETLRPEAEASEIEVRDSLRLFDRELRALQRHEADRVQARRVLLAEV